MVERRTKCVAWREERGTNEESIVRFGRNSRRGERFRLRRPGQRKRKSATSSSDREEGLI
jgi:hypothetical protein